MTQKDIQFKNLLPPLKLLNDKDKNELFTKLDQLDFNINMIKAA